MWLRISTCIAGWLRSISLRWRSSRRITSSTIREAAPYRDEKVRRLEAIREVAKDGQCGPEGARACCQIRTGPPPRAVNTRLYFDDARLAASAFGGNEHGPAPCEGIQHKITAPRAVSDGI